MYTRLVRSLAQFSDERADELVQLAERLARRLVRVAQPVGEKEARRGELGRRRLIDRDEVLTFTRDCHSQSCMVYIAISQAR